MKAVITGATGAIGTALVQNLINNQIEVLVLVRPGSERNNKIIDSPLVSVTECGLDGYKSLELKQHYDVFYHLAWAGTTGAQRNDKELQERNVQYALEAVSLAKRLGCKRFIGIGSQAEYGRVEGMLASTTPTNPEMEYGVAKLRAGQETRRLAFELGMEHIWVRVLSVYGPNDGAQSMVMSTINKLKDGTVPQFTRGEQLWDYLYSMDAGKALCMLTQMGVSGKTYVLGSGQARPLSEYILTIRDIVNPQCDIALGAIPYADRQVMHLQADISELTKDTGWVPETSFEEGIRSLV